MEGNCSSCVMFRGFGKHILHFSHFFFMMVQLEFLQGEHVNHYGNFRRGEKKLLWMYFCAQVAMEHRWITLHTRLPPTPLSLPSPPKAIPLQILGSVPCKVFSLRIYQGSQQENGSSDFPFWCGWNLINNLIPSFHSWGVSGPERVSYN